MEIIANRRIYTPNNSRFSGLIEKLWTHSLSCVFSAEFIINLLHLRLDQDAFTLGSTHDIGKLVLIQVIGKLERKGRLIQRIETDKLINTLEAYHEKFGAVLLKRWWFNSVFRDVAMYHDYFESVKEYSQEYICVHFTKSFSQYP
jgi:HD-like signal output (HDOD) protein